MALCVHLKICNGNTSDIYSQLLFPGAWLSPRGARLETRGRFGISSLCGSSRLGVGPDLLAQHSLRVSETREATQCPCHRDCPWAHPPGHTWPPAGTSLNPELEIPSFKGKRGLALTLTRSLTKPVYIVHNVQISYNSHLRNTLELVCVQKAQRTRHAPRQRGCWGTLWGTLSFSLARGSSAP